MTVLHVCAPECEDCPRVCDCVCCAQPGQCPRRRRSRFDGVTGDARKRLEGADR